MTKDLKTVSMQEGVRKTKVLQTRRDKFRGGKDNRILNRCSLWLLGRKGKNVKFLNIQISFVNFPLEVSRSIQTALMS